MYKAKKVDFSDSVTQSAFVVEANINIAASSHDRAKCKKRQQMPSWVGATDQLQQGAIEDI